MFIVDDYRHEPEIEPKMPPQHISDSSPNDREIIEIEEKLRLAEARLAEFRLAANTLEGLLKDARSRPIKQLKRLIVRRFLMLLAKMRPIVSDRARARFLRSAAKRDPNRSDFFRDATKPNYEQVLKEWARQRLRSKQNIAQIIEKSSNFPKFSIIVPVYNTNPQFLSEMIESVRSQSYTNWELCFADDASSCVDTKNILTDASHLDERIKVVFREQNGHISEASNTAIDIATGEFLVLLDHDDLLDPDALFYIAQTIEEHPQAQIVYTDEDKIDEKGKRFEPHFKPDWNRELIYGCNYVSHLGVYDASLVRSVNGFRVGLEGAQDHDLLLRCIASIPDSHIQHIPKVLYSWRCSSDSTAKDPNSKPYAWDAGVLAVTDALSAKAGRAIKVERGPHPFSYLPIWPLPQEPSVSIIIPTRDRLDITRNAVESILNLTDYGNYKIVIIDNGSVEEETISWFEEISDLGIATVLKDQGPFNYSGLNNMAVGTIDSDLVAFVNNDIEVISKNWLREMASLAIRQEVGCVGAKLYYPDGRIQHAGVVLGMGGVAGHSHRLYDRNDSGYFGRLKLRQEYTAVTAACLVVRREVFEKVGGFDETDLAVAFNDVDLCLKVKRAGYKNLWTPLAELYHHESASRKTEDTPEKRARFEKEVRHMMKTWNIASVKDPSYNPNLSLEADDFRLGMARWD